MKMISEFTDHDRIEGQFLLGSVSKGVNTNGGSYFSVELRDASGQITAKKWDATLQDEEIFVTGNVISLIGETNRYKDALQLKILSAEVVPLDEIDVEFSDKAACCVIMASDGYPEKYDKGYEITIPADVNANVYIAGAKLADDGKLLTNGGRVLGVTEIADTLEMAIDESYKTVSKIHFDNAYYRNDIGKKALEAVNGI